MASLTTKILGSLVWIFSNMVTTNLITFVRTVVLWKLLDAADFGLNATIWLVLQSLSFLQDMGFSQALIQRRTSVAKAATVTFYVNLVINSTLYALFFSSAPLVAGHFEEPQLVLLIRVASLAILVRGLSATSFALLRKEFRFRAILWTNTAELLVATTAQVWLAVLGYGVWSLVWGHLIGVGVRAATLLAVRPIPLLSPDFTVARELFHFGKHVTLSALFLWLVKNMDNYFVGKHLGMVALGFYSLAYRLSHLLSAKVTRMFGAVLFPAFSEIGRDYARLRRAWFQAIRYCMLVILPLGVGLMVFSPEVILGFYPAECAVAIAPTIVLTFFALCRGFGITLGDVARGIGKPELVTRAAFWHAILMAPALYAAVHSAEALSYLLTACARLTGFSPGVLPLGLALGRLELQLFAVSAAVSATAVCALGYTFYLCSREVSLAPSEALRAVSPGLVAALAMALCGWLAKEGLYRATPSRLTVLFVAGPLSCAVYALVIRVFYPDIVLELKALLEKRRRGAKKARAPAPAEPVEQN